MVQKSADVVRSDGNILDGSLDACRTGYGKVLARSHERVFGDDRGALFAYVLHKYF